jgi:uncharacterized protein
VWRVRAYTARYWPAALFLLVLAALAVSGYQAHLQQQRDAHDAARQRARRAACAVARQYAARIQLLTVVTRDIAATAQVARRAAAAAAAGRGDVGARQVNATAAKRYAHQVHLLTDLPALPCGR